ncbi:uncharacterized transporter slc-17.2-like isoform X2 [Ctenocephalides felis]|uniref:uncharacterized transporter slc-17.2-like isoform X2 n=1 Tax=Ctenocephalides felis TaxID=7515 RepID=UPI000E6E2932|nr:uncharacterized transporter slc-17.2-like isoform X2 [Ctenocephalides felis]
MTTKHGTGPVNKQEDSKNGHNTSPNHQHQSAPNNHQHHQQESPPMYTLPHYPLWGSCRLVFTLCAFLTTTNLILMRFNLSFALVCMIKGKDLNGTLDNWLPKEGDANFTRVRQPGCYALEESDGGAVSLYDMAEFDWSKELQGRLLSGFFYGYIVSQAFGGWFSDKFGGKLFFVLGNLLQSICTLLMPVAARLHPEMLFVLRIIQGIVCGLCLPAMYVLFAKWASPAERTKLMGVAYTGFPLANVIIFPLASTLCQTGIDGGWPMIFYVTGGFGTLCSIVYYFVVFDDADSHPRIAPGERRYLNSVIARTNNKKMIVPWGSIIKSVPVHAYNVAHFCQTWAFVTLAINLPMLMKEVLYFDLKANGLLSALPYICALIMRIAIAYLFKPVQDFLGLSITNMRKMNHLIGTIIPGISILCIALLSCEQKYLAVFLIMLTAMFTDIAFTGSYLLSYLELAPRFAGLLTGISNTIGSMPGVITNTLVGYITTNVK